MQKTIIIVEDEPLIALDLEEIIEQEGYNAVKDITSYEMAIKAIETLNPVLVLIDINLKKKKDGTDIAAYLLEKDKIPYIYISANVDKISLNKASATRPYGFIVKPFKPIDVKTSISIAINNFIHRKIDVTRHKVIVDTDIPFILKQIIIFIDENIDEKLDIENLAAKTRWKYHHFLRLFKEYVNQTPYQYIINKKIEKAKTQLIETYIPISEIAFNLGFDSHGSFTNTFKKNVGQSPETFRKFNMVSKHL